MYGGEEIKMYESMKQYKAEKEELLMNIPYPDQFLQHLRHIQHKSTYDN